MTNLVGHVPGMFLAAHAAVNKGDVPLPSWSSHFNKYFGSGERENTQRNTNPEHLTYNLQLDVLPAMIS